MAAIDLWKVMGGGGLELFIAAGIVVGASLLVAVAMLVIYIY